MAKIIFFNYLKTYFDITIHPDLKPDTADINNIVNTGDLYYYGYGVQQNFELAKSVMNLLRE